MDFSVEKLLIAQVVFL